MRKASLALVFLLGSVVGILVALNAPTVRGQTFTVTTNQDSGAGSLRQAILDANVDNVADVINFNLASPATITVASQLPTISQPLTISGPGAASLTVSGGDTTSIFRVGVGVTVTISGMTIADGAATEAAGIFNAGGVLTLDNVVMSGNNSTQFGGAIISTGTLTVNGSTFSQNTAGIRGGAIEDQGTQLTVTDSSFTSNTVTGDGVDTGGAAIATGGTVSVSGSTFTRNSTGNYGGAILNHGGSVTASTSTFASNSAGVDGGAIFGDALVTRVQKSTFQGNSADNGGAIRSNDTEFTVGNSTFSANSASVDGGAVYVSSGAGATVSFSTFVNNTAVSAASGGNIFNAGSASIRNTILSGGSPDNCDGTVAIANSGGNLSTDATCTGFTQVTVLQLNLGLLASNGGPTQTHALQTGSVAIDAAPACTSVAGGTVTEDQRGVVRPQGTACDIGAYEIVATGPAPTPTATATTTAPTATATATQMATATATATQTATATATETSQASPTATKEAKDDDDNDKPRRPTATATRTPTQTATLTPEVTESPTPRPNVAGAVVPLRPDRTPVLGVAPSAPAQPVTAITPPRTGDAGLADASTLSSGWGVRVAAAGLLLGLGVGVVGRSRSRY